MPIVKSLLEIDNSLKCRNDAELADDVANCWSTRES